MQQSLTDHYAFIIFMKVFVIVNLFHGFDFFFASLFYQLVAEREL